MKKLALTGLATAALVALSACSAHVVDPTQRDIGAWQNQLQQEMNGLQPKSSASGMGVVEYRAGVVPGPGVSSDFGANKGDEYVLMAACLGSGTVTPSVEIQYDSDTSEVFSDGSIKCGTDPKLRPATTITFKKQATNEHSGMAATLKPSGGTHGVAAWALIQTKPPAPDAAKMSQTEEDAAIKEAEAAVKARQAALKEPFEVQVSKAEMDAKTVELKAAIDAMEGVTQSSIGSSFDLKDGLGLITEMRDTSKPAPGGFKNLTFKVACMGTGAVRPEIAVMGKNTEHGSGSAPILCVNNATFVDLLSVEIAATTEEITVTLSPEPKTQAVVAYALVNAEQ